MRACAALMVLLVVWTFTACDKPQPASSPASSSPAPASNEFAAPESAPSPATPPTSTEIKRVDAADLALGEYMPPLDGGRIEIAPPADWSPMPRDSKYLVRFYKLSRNSLPRIEVVVEERNLGGFTDVTEANVAEFAAAVAQDLEASGTAVIEPPIPMLIGSMPCARYVSHLKLKIGEGTLLVERQTLALLRAGRLYKINLLVLPNQLAASRDDGYAVCSSVRFPAGE